MLVLVKRGTGGSFNDQQAYELHKSYLSAFAQIDMEAAEKYAEPQTMFLVPLPIGIIFIRMVPLACLFQIPR